MSAGQPSFFLSLTQRERKKGKIIFIEITSYDELQRGKL